MGFGAPETDGPVAAPDFYSEIIDPNGAPSDLSMGGARFATRNENESVGFNVEWEVTDSLDLNFDYHDSTAESRPDSPYGSAGVLGVAKLLGVVAVLAPRMPVVVREWAYAGFGITLVAAAFSHLASGDTATATVAPLVALVLGLGISLTTGVVEGEADGLAKTIGTAIPGVFLICIAAFSPLALFKLLAFVDPGTSSGAAMRAGYEAQGGLRGLTGRAVGTSNAASSVDGHGRSTSEVSQEGQANQRAAQATSSLASKGGSAIGPVAGAIGSAVGVGVGLMVSAGTRGAAIGADLSNQMGAGHNTYVPDFQPTRRTGDRHRLTHPEQRGEDTRGSSGGGEAGGGAVQAPPPAQTNPSTGAGPLPPSGAGAAGAAGGAGAGAAGAAAGAAK